jgi:Transglutaminase-like superfamily/TgpA N-terminal domain
MTTITAGAAPGTEARRTGARGIAPARDELIDVGALVVLTMIGIVGFRPAYGGHGYLAAGAAGVLLGLLLSHAGQRARLPLLAVVAASTLAFLAFGGVVSQTGTVSLPTLQAITSTAVSGWQQLLTTARPVGRTAGLLVLPYLLGMFSAIAGHALARRTAAVLLPAAAPAVVVALSILFGAPQPTDAALQGAGFAAAALAWAAWRQERGTGRQATIGRQRPWQRIGTAAAVLAVAGAGATVIGPHLPGAGAHQRVVLTAVPPFNVDDYSSPLASYRDYTTVAPPAISVFGKKLLTTTLPAKTRVRIAAMDTYDGLAWGVANASATGAFGGFQRVGTLLPGAPAGAAETATITTTANYRLPWLPDVAGITGFSFGAAGSQAAAELRYNAATATGLVIPGEVPAGLSYTVSYVPVPAPALNAIGSADPGGTPDLCAQDESGCIQVPPAVQEFANQHDGTASTPTGKVLALAAYLLGHGRYSDGAGAQSSVLPGHGAGRLTTFLDTSPITGDDEQYAATMALLANWVGVPARVSLDAVVEANGSVYGQDVHADVELDTSQFGWVTLPYTAFTPTKSPIIKQQTENAPPEPVKVVPPRHNQSAPVTDANSSNAVARTAPAPANRTGFVIPAVVLVLARDVGIPAVALAALAAALAGAKALRRRRRRALGPPAARVAGAWRELIDLGRDLGIERGAAVTPGAPAPPGAAGAAGSPGSSGTPGPAVSVAGGGAMTRREFAAYAEARGLSAASAVAVAADAATFGPADPDGAAVRHVWQLVETARRGATARLPRWRRTWVAVNPASLWASRAVLDRAVAQARRAARSRAVRGPAARGHGRARTIRGGAYR